MSSDVDFESKQKTTAKVIAWSICGLASIFYCYEYILRVSPSIMTSDLMLTYHINAAALGNLIAFYYYIYTPMQLPVGMLMDVYGPRRLLTLAGLSCAIGTYLFASTDIFVIAAFGRFLVGFGSAFAFIGVLKLAALWLPPERFALISGIASTLGVMGGMIGYIILTILIDHYGWRLSSYWVACFGIVLTLLMFFALRDGKASQGYGQHEAPTLKGILRGSGRIIRNPQIWINGLIGCLLYLPTSVFAELWGVPFLSQALHFSPSAAANAVALIFLGWATGGPIAGFISDTLKRRRLPLTIGAVMEAILFSIVLYVPHIPAYTVCIIFYLFGFFSGAQIIIYAVSREISSSKASGTAFALTNMFVMIGGAIFQPVVGILLEWRGGQAVEGLHIYSASAYQYALAVLPLGLVLTVFLTFLLKETHCRVSVES
jgi:sugar phosphate permease